MRHMVEHAREALALVSGRSREGIHSNRMLQLALTRLVEVVGEAAGRVSPETSRGSRAYPGARRSPLAIGSPTGTTLWTTTFCGTRCWTTSRL